MIGDLLPPPATPQGVKTIKQNQFLSRLLQLPECEPKTAEGLWTLFSKMMSESAQYRPDIRAVIRDLSSLLTDGVLPQAPSYVPNCTVS
jgi:hypothetical protein